MSTFWVTMEGLEGVGKTYLSRRLAQRLGPSCVLVSELTDLVKDSLPGQVITALLGAHDPFLRTGHPLTETFALLALKVREHERLRATSDLGVSVILEDRGLDSVALYQAAILAGDRSVEQIYAVAQRIYAAAARWRPAPNLTVLLIDDVDVCAQRFSTRLGRPLQSDERNLMHRASELYAMRADAEPQRFVLVDRSGQTEEQTLNVLYRICSH